MKKDYQNQYHQDHQCHQHHFHDHDQRDRGDQGGGGGDVLLHRGWSGQGGDVKGGWGGEPAGNHEFPILCLRVLNDMRYIALTYRQYVE